MKSRTHTEGQRKCLHPDIYCHQQLREGVAILAAGSEAWDFWGDVEGHTSSPTLTGNTTSTSPTLGRFTETAVLNLRGVQHLGVAWEKGT